MVAHWSQFSIVTISPDRSTGSYNLLTNHIRIYINYTDYRGSCAQFVIHYYTLDWPFPIVHNDLQLKLKPLFYR